MMLHMTNDQSGPMYFLPGQSKALLLHWAEYTADPASVNTEPGAWAGTVNPGGEELARFAAWLEENGKAPQRVGGSGSIISFLYSSDNPLTRDNFQALMQIQP